MNTRGQGRVFQRGAYLWVAYYAHGEEQREVARHVRTNEKLDASEKNQREALRFLKRRLGEITAEQHGGRPFVGPLQERVTVNELLDGLERDYKLRDKWSVKVESVFKPLRQRFGTWRAVDLTSDAIGAYIEELRGEYSNGSINRRTQLLGQAFKTAIRSQQLSQQPFIPRLSEVGNERQGFFETADFEAVVAKLPEYLRDFCRFGFVTGWRKGSIESLRWADVGEDVIYLRAKNSKTRKPETMPIEGDLQDIVDRRRAAGVLHSDHAPTRFAEFVFHRKWPARRRFSQGLGERLCQRRVGQNAISRSSTHSLTQHDFRRRSSGRGDEDYRTPHGFHVPSLCHRQRRAEARSACQDAAIPGRFGGS